jgi:two-component system chemotaxis response regulator CheB
LRIIEELAELASRMQREVANAGRTSTAQMYERRAAEYREHSETLRRAVISSFEKFNDRAYAGSGPASRVAPEPELG